MDEQSKSSSISGIDEDCGREMVVIDVTAAEKWGPKETFAGGSFIDEPKWFCNEYLYRLPKGLFVRVRERFHLEGDFWEDPLFKRFSNEEAAKWLVFGNFDLPGDIAHLADKHRFKDGVPASLPDNSGEQLVDGHKTKQTTPDHGEVEFTNRNPPKCTCGGLMITTTTRGKTQYRKCNRCSATGKTTRRS